MTGDRETPGLVDYRGRPIRDPKNTTCPKCGAGADRRVASGGFGDVHDVCGVCGYEGFGERTV